MEVFFFKALQFIGSLSIIVLIHELGHFLGARITATRVDKFYLFFNPWFSLFKKKHKHTEYGIGWLPLGGFVKIAGMVDESMDKEQLAQPAAPWEYRSKKPWHKLIMITGGVVFNFLLAWLIYIIIFCTWGETYIASKHLPYGIVADSAAQSVGFRDGDLVVKLDDKEAQGFEKVPMEIITGGVKQVGILRDGKAMTLTIPEDFGAAMINDKNLSFLSIRLPNQPLDSVMPASIAKTIGLKKGDKIVAFNEKPIAYWSDLTRAMSANKGQEIVLRIQRDTHTFALPKVVIPERSLLGVIPSSPFSEQHEMYVRVSYSLWRAIPAGFSKSISTLVNYWSQLKIVFGGKVNVNENLGGLISMGKVFPEQWSWIKFLLLTAFFSLGIGLMNILPIPALDGGHMVIILLEWITGKKIPLKALGIIQTVGFILLLALIFYTQGLDILRLFK